MFIFVRCKMVCFITGDPSNLSLICVKFLAVLRGSVLSGENPNTLKDLKKLGQDQHYKHRRGFPLAPS